MTPNRKAALFLLAIAALVIVIGAIVGVAQSAGTTNCQISNGTAELTATIHGRPTPTPAPCGVRPVAWIILGAGGIFAVIGATLFIAGATPTTSSGQTPTVEKERQYRRIA